jgi:hypothetical protein
MSAVPTLFSQRVCAAILGRSRGAIASMVSEGRLVTIAPAKRPLVTHQSVADLRGYPVSAAEFARAVASLQPRSAAQPSSTPRQKQRWAQHTKETSRGHVAAF